MHFDLLCFLVVLSLASCVCAEAFNNGRAARGKFRGQHHLEKTNSRTGAIDNVEDFGEYIPSPKRNRRKEMRNQQQQQQQGKRNEGRLRVEECCPEVLELAEPEVGRDRNGIALELYRDTNVQQRFYEISCGEDVAGEPCRFVDRKHKRSSRCVQQYSYTYALVRDHDSHLASSARASLFADEEATPTSPWRLDYIKVRSGCRCEVETRRKKRKAKNTELALRNG